MHFIGKHIKSWNKLCFTDLFKQGSPAPALYGIGKSMALIGNKLYRQLNSKAEEAAEIDQQLARMEDEIRKLKIDFDIYFNSTNKRPPLESRARLESFVKRIADNRNLTYAQRYYFNTLVARFTSYRELWRRTLKAKG